MRVKRGIVTSLLILGAISASHQSAAAQEVRMGPALARAALGSASPTERALAACHLSRMTANEVRPARDQLLAMLTDDTPVEGRLCRDYYRFGGNERQESSPGREAAIALEELGTEVLDPLLRVLEGQNAAGRENAALGLGLIENPRAIPALASALGGDNVAGVRARSAWSLGLIEDPDAVLALARALRTDTDGKTRSESAWALGMIEDPAGVPPLLEAFDDAVADVRSQAAWALGMIESPEGVDPLVEALGDSDAEVRSQAAWGLGMIESNQATSGLIRTLGSDRDAEVRSQAAWALGMIEDPEATEALLEAIEDESPEVQKQAMWALTRVLQTGGFSRVDRSELAAKLRRALSRDPRFGIDL